ncbi:DUF1996 domain-containing protein [Sphingomonas endolithica]|uniref:DUF1996 domain-containing protein n=1 Tax=Sphingomonas endolithica TaxID=2972485 RepID=UPI0021AE7F01|nr:DUF1996 domain-containing protein [Sphingomonas sp. ZFBP2030]
MRKPTILAALLFALSAAPAFSQGRPANAVAQDGSDAPVLANEFGPQPAIADGLSTAVGGGLRKTDPSGPPPSAAPDNLGAWRINCFPTHSAADDPIVSPGKPGKAHPHTFFGNVGTDANSTYTSLRTTGESTCVNKLWRSAYWLPAVIDGPGVNAKLIWPQSVVVL